MGKGEPGFNCRSQTERALLGNGAFCCTARQSQVEVADVLEGGAQLGLGGLADAVELQTAPCQCIIIMHQHAMQQPYLHPFTASRTRVWSAM